MFVIRRRWRDVCYADRCCLMFIFAFFHNLGKAGGLCCRFRGICDRARFTWLYSQCQVENKHLWVDTPHYSVIYGVISGVLRHVSMFYFDGLVREKGLLTNRGLVYDFFYPGCYEIYVTLISKQVDTKRVSYACNIIVCVKGI